MSEVARMQRKLFVQYIDASFGGTTAAPYRLGKDFEEFNTEMNPDTETSKNILGETTFTHNGYEKSADGDPFYAREGDALFEKLQEIIDQEKQYEGTLTTVYDVHLWEAGTTTGSFKAYAQQAYVIPTSYGGDTSGYQIPFNITYVGERTEGTFVPDGAGSGTFTPST